MAKRSRRGPQRRNRLIGEGATEETAVAWIAAWEAKAAEDSLEWGSAYWQAGWNLDRRAGPASRSTLGHAMARRRRHRRRARQVAHDS
ncbi:MAG TPA: hypothetical protein VFP66_00610 [Candidatus Limnocylindrales bacterium]|nr:hypothetical protein [Candidatus Limnocylindrales bacterium]